MHRFLNKKRNNFAKKEENPKAEHLKTHIHPTKVLMFFFCFRIFSFIPYKCLTCHFLKIWVVNLQPTITTQYCLFVLLCCPYLHTYFIDIFSLMLFILRYNDVKRESEGEFIITLFSSFSLQFFFLC